jgi:hypothetical protein
MEFASTKNELLNLNACLKQNSQQVGGWTHKVFELELAEPCGFNEKVGRLREFVGRYGVLPGHAKNFSLKELEEQRVQEVKVEAEAKVKEDNEPEATGEGGESNVTESGSANAEGGEEVTEKGEPIKDENVADIQPAEQSEEMALAELNSFLADTNNGEAANNQSTEQNAENNNEQSNKENCPSHPPTEPFTEEEVKTLATFISSMKLKVKKNKSLAKTQPHRMQALTDCGVRLFETENAARFDEMFDRLLAYKKEMGTFRMPSLDICKESGDEELIALHNWVFSQVGSFRYQLKTKNPRDVKKFLDVGFSFEKWYGSNGHVFERDIPPFDALARQYAENGGIVPPEYDELINQKGKYGDRKRKSLHGPRVKRYSGPDRRLKKNRHLKDDADVTGGNEAKDSQVNV